MWATWPIIAVQAESISNIGKEIANYRHLFNNSAAKIKSVLNRKNTTSTKGGRRLKYKTRKLKRRRKQRGGAADKCLFVQLFGGLGNQLYMYAAALTLSKKTGLSVCTPPHILNKHSNKEYSELLNTEHIQKTPDADKRINSADFIINKPEKYYSRWSDAHILKGKSNDKRMPEDYYQNYKSIHRVIPEIKEILYANELNNEKYKKYKIASETSAFMHVRRGDYVELGKLEADQYYIDALKELDKNNKIVRIYVLSNDISWCKGQEAIWKMHTKKQIECKDIEDELETLYFMSQCTAGAIIPSSSFSSWGVFLGADMNPASTIIYPKKSSFNLNVRKTNPHEFPERWTGI
jgi:hypothetical protein